MKQKQAWTGAAPSQCDLCSSAIATEFIDGKTVHGPWGNMCPQCHSIFGVGVGEGQGQRYRKDETGSFVKVK